MEPRGGLFCSKAFRGIKMSKNPLGNLELDVVSANFYCTVAASGSLQVLTPVRFVNSFYMQ